MTPPITISPLYEKDIPIIVDAFAKASWPKPASTFEQYFKEQIQHDRYVWLAYQGQQLAGYVTLTLKSAYIPFQTMNIPEIMDLNVLPSFRKQGIGSLLTACAEEEAFKHHDTVGIGVGLYADYGQAIKIYIDRGYKPDGRGVTYNYQLVAPGDIACVDDDLVLWFSKKHPSFRQTTPLAVQSIHNSHHLKIEFTATPNEHDIDYLTQKINEETPYKEGAKPFAFYIRDDSNTIIAGCSGEVMFGVVYTGLLWVHPNYRKQRLARKLMDKAHEHGVQMGCHIASILTMSFQSARGFYERLGYECDLERHGYIDNSTCLFLKKELSEQ